MLEKALGKILSGRFILTILAGAVFVKVSWNMKLPDAAIASIITAVFMSYFQKNRGENV